MPLFNEIFVFYWFNAFLKFSNMFEVFAALNGQSYKSILERMHPTTDGSGNPSQDPVINENTIAYLHLCDLQLGCWLRPEATKDPDV